MGTVNRVTVGGGLAVVGVLHPWPVLVGMGSVVLVLITGVVLPAVWAKKATRRAAAARVLGQLLAALRSRHAERGS